MIIFLTIQVYKIENSENDQKGIFIAANGLYELIKHEASIIAAAMSYNADEVENSFNQLVAEALENYNVFMAKVPDEQDMLRIDVTTNLAELFEVILDIKKTEAENTAAAVVAATAVAAAAPPVIAVEDSPPAKVAKKNEKAMNRR